MSELKPGWNRWRFEQIATSITNRVDDPSEADVEYYVGLEHLDSDSLKIRRWGSPDDVSATKLLFEPGDIIFGRRRAYQRKLGVAEFRGIASAHSLILRAKPEVVLPEFLPFFMQSDLFMERAQQISVGSLSPTINWKTLAKQEFALPPLAEQRRIAALFLKKEQLLNSLIEAENNIHIIWRALSKQQFSKTFDPTQQVQLAQYYQIGSGQVDPRTPSFMNLPLIAPNHIEGNTGKIIAIETAKEQNSISGKYLFEKNDVLYSKIRPNLMKAVIAPCKGLCSADMYVLTPNPALRRNYLLEILLSDHFTAFAVSGSLRTAMPKLNRKHLTQYKCNLPSLSEQDAYLEQVSAIQTSQTSIKGHIDKAHQLKQNLFMELK